MRHQSIAALVLFVIAFEIIFSARHRQADRADRHAETAETLHRLKGSLESGRTESVGIHHDGWGRPLEIESMPANTRPGRQVVTIRSYGSDGVRQEQGGDDLVASFYVPPVHVTSQIIAEEFQESSPIFKPLFQMHDDPSADGRINLNGEADRATEVEPTSLSPLR
jgi:hypothetical protein